VKYTPPGGRVEVVGGSEDSEITIRISDTGIGIPEGKIPRIFERFYRVDKARSKATGGTGLGLSIVRHVAENHGGRVTVQSTPGEGSTFTVYLPRA
jgi:signal transduction histidine kinase